MKEILEVIHRMQAGIVGRYAVGRQRTAFRAEFTYSHPGAGSSRAMPNEASSAMKNMIACNYAVVRFLPYPETEEFVNIGVVMACPQTGMFDYRIETRRRERITGFFPELEVGALLDGRKAFIRELDRIKTEIHRHAQAQQQQLPFRQQEINQIFRELVRPRESVFRFGGIGTALAEDADRKLTELFAHYVERQFAQHEEYQETIMARRLTRVFRDARIEKLYEARRLGNELYHVTIPFVREEEQRFVRAIKPLNLDQPDSTRILEHGDRWLRRIERLRDMECLPERLLFVIRQPESGRPYEAAAEVRRELEREHADTAPENDRDAVLSFARAD